MKSNKHLKGCKGISCLDCPKLPTCEFALPIKVDDQPKRHNASKNEEGTIMSETKQKPKTKAQVLNTVRRDPELDFENYTYPLRFKKDNYLALLNELSPKIYDGCFETKKIRVSPINKAGCQKIISKLVKDNPELLESATKVIFSTLQPMKEYLEGHIAQISSNDAKKLKVAESSKIPQTKLSGKFVGNAILKRGKFITQNQV